MGKMRVDQPSRLKEAMGPEGRTRRAFTIAFYINKDTGGVEPVLATSPDTTDIDLSMGMWLAKQARHLLEGWNNMQQGEEPDPEPRVIRSTESGGNGG